MKQRITFLTRILPALLLAATLLGACGGESGGGDKGPTGTFANRITSFDQGPGKFFIEGAYTDDWGSPHTITSTTWDQGFGLFHILSLAPDMQYLIAQNDAGNAWNAGLFSRFDLAVQNGTLYYCQIEYGAADAATAEANTSANRDDLAEGCSGFAWSNLGLLPWFYFQQPWVALGAPGEQQGVVSLGYDPLSPTTAGGSITLGFGSNTQNRCIVDGPGADLVVYENAFPYADGTGEGTYNEVMSLEFSADGQPGSWHPLTPLVNTALPEIDPARYTYFAGVTPTANGGDAFDLADVIAEHGLAADFQACYVRLTDGGTLYGDLGNINTDLHYSGADLDAVEVLNWVEMVP